MKKIKKITVVPMVSCGIFLASAVMALADTSTSSTGGWNLSQLDIFGLPNPSGGILEIITNFLYWILAIFGIIGIIGFIISGLMYLTAAGDDTQTGKAKKAMMASIIGIIVGLSGLVVIQAIDWALNGFSYF